MKKALIISFLIITLLFSNFMALTLAAPPEEKVSVIVGFKDKPNANLINGHGGEVRFQYTIISAIAANLPKQAIDALSKNPSIAYIEEDAEVFAHVIYDDELDYSWGVKQIGSGTVHEWGNKGAGVNVAVIDTGIDYRHMDLKANYRGGYDFVNGDNDPMDDNGHGTHCAGIIAAADDDYYDHPVVGVAPEANLYALKVLNRRGSGTTSTIIAGIDWATKTLSDSDPDNNINVISMSLGSSVSTDSLKEACDNAYAAGILVVASAGNSGDGGTLSTIGYPAAYDSVIAVGATDKQNIRASFSSTGPQLELVAPGVDILSTYRYVSKDGLYRDVVYMSGTSMACPHVAGTAALVFASPIDQNYDSDGDYQWDAVEIRSKLQQTADKPLTEYNTKPDWYGYGLVDADQASDTSAVDNSPPTVTELTPADGEFINTDDPLISAKLTDNSGINWESVALTLDESAVLSSYDASTSIVSFQAADLAEGEHKVTLYAADINGNDDTKVWWFTIDITPPEVEGLTATAISSSQINLQWINVGDAVKYEIYRGGKLISETTDSSYLDNGLEASTTYTYSVKAVDKAGNAGVSSLIEMTTLDLPVQVLHVQDITMSSESKKIGRFTSVLGTATVTIVDASGMAVSGVSVTGKWSGAADDTDSGITDSNGQVTFKSNSVRTTTSLTFTLTVENVALSGWTYEPNSNDITSNSITIP
ncbi:MAG: S8 family serine peptidase [Candidatus Bathyarchaeota archaeon]|nr:S8 family serine peptidase [Candidatus Bathyarchaeota archaeon]